MSQYMCGLDWYQRLQGILRSETGGDGSTIVMADRGLVVASRLLTGPDISEQNTTEEE